MSSEYYEIWRHKTSWDIMRHQSAGSRCSLCVTWASNVSNMEHFRKTIGHDGARTTPVGVWRWGGGGGALKQLWHHVTPKYDEYSPYSRTLLMWQDVSTSGPLLATPGRHRNSHSGLCGQNMAKCQRKVSTHSVNVFASFAQVSLSDQRSLPRSLGILTTSQEQPLGQTVLAIFFQIFHQIFLRHPTWSNMIQHPIWGPSRSKLPPPPLQPPPA